MGTTKFILIRHGETIWNKERKMQGQTDIPLSEIGIAQANRVGIYLKNAPMDVLYTSPLKRAFVTAVSIHHYHKHIPLITHKSLKERLFGDLEGMVYEDIVTNYPRMAFNISWHYPHYQPPNGERLIDVQERIELLLKEILTQHKGKTVAIVSHGVTLRVFMKKLMDLPFSLAGDLSTGNTSCAFIEYDPITKGRFHFINHMKHLE